MVDILDLDYETRSEKTFKVDGLDRYVRHSSTRVLMAAYGINGGPIKHWDRAAGQKMPADLRDALEDPDVFKWAFNAQFERTVTNKLLGIISPVRRWRCSMVLAYMHSFTGTLADVTAQMQMPTDERKDGVEGKRLVNLFCRPQRVTKANPHVWRDFETDPEDWFNFSDYNVDDVGAERGIKNRLLKYPVLPDEWDFYELDQIINDRGVPVNMAFVRSCLEMADRRKAELNAQLAKMTGLANPNSVQQMVPWLRERGYPFEDLRKESVAKVLYEFEEGLDHRDLTSEAVAVLEIRRWSAKTSTTKLDKIQNNEVGGRVRYTTQFAGASRTNRFAGRSFQPHNMVRTPKVFATEEWYEMTVQMITDGEYDDIPLMVGEPMLAFTGCLRAAIQAEEGDVLDVSDLSAIESRLLGYVSGCVRLNKVFEDGRDPYNDFGAVYYSKPYDKVTRKERQDVKPAVLGCGYRLGGGELRSGKKTGLWGYAESMGTRLTQDFCHRAVALFRENYPEIVQLWYDLENAVSRVLRLNQPITVGPVTFKRLPPYLCAVLPGDRHMYYYQPRLEARTFHNRNGEPYVKHVFTYMGLNQDNHQWERVDSHGGKIVENLVQAIARDVLKECLKRANKAGYFIPLHVHDELITEHNRNAKGLTLDRLTEIMAQPIDYLPGLILGAQGFSAKVYRKD